MNDGAVYNFGDVFTRALQNAAERSAQNDRFKKDMAFRQASLKQTSDLFIKQFNEKMREYNQNFGEQKTQNRVSNAFTKRGLDQGDTKLKQNAKSISNNWDLGNKGITANKDIAAGHDATNLAIAKLQKQWDMLKFNWQRQMAEKKFSVPLKLWDYYKNNPQQPTPTEKDYSGDLGNAFWGGVKGMFTNGGGPGGMAIGALQNVALGRKANTARFNAYKGSLDNGAINQLVQDTGGMVLDDPRFQNLGLQYYNAKQTANKAGVTTGPLSPIEQIMMLQGVPNGGQ